MSFRVACANGFCGSDCTASHLSNAQISMCNSTTGDIVCTDSRYDPSAVMSVPTIWTSQLTVPPACIQTLTQTPTAQLVYHLVLVLTMTVPHACWKDMTH